GQLDGGRKLLRGETNEPLSEVFEHQSREALDGNGDHLKHPRIAAVLYSQPPSSLSRRHDQADRRRRPDRSSPHIPPASSTPKPLRRCLRQAKIRTMPTPR